MDWTGIFNNSISFNDIILAHVEGAPKILFSLLPNCYIKCDANQPAIPIGAASGKFLKVPIFVFFLGSFFFFGLRGGGIPPILLW